MLVRFPLSQHDLSARTLNRAGTKGELKMCLLSPGRHGSVDWHRPVHKVPSSISGLPGEACTLSPPRWAQAGSGLTAWAATHQGLLPEGSGRVEASSDSPIMTSTLQASAVTHHPCQPAPTAAPHLSGGQRLRSGCLLRNMPNPPPLSRWRRV